MKVWKYDLSILTFPGIGPFGDEVHGRACLAKAIGCSPDIVRLWWNGVVAPSPENQAKLAALARTVSGGAASG